MGIFLSYYVICACITVIFILRDWEGYSQHMSGGRPIEIPEDVWVAIGSMFSIIMSPIIVPAFIVYFVIGFFK